MAIPTSFTWRTEGTQHDYAFVPTTGVDFPAGPCRALWIQHNNTGSITVITANGDSVVVGVANGMALLPLRVKQISVNGGATPVSIVALY